MERYEDLYETPADKLDAFVEQSLQPDREWKGELQDAQQRIERFLREECFYNELVLDREVRVLKVVKGGSSGKGTTLNHSSDLDLVLFLDCFTSFCHQANLRGFIISFIEGKLSHCSRSLAYNITMDEPREGDSAPRSLSFRVQSRRSSTVIQVDVLPAFDALGPSSPDWKPSPEIYKNLISSVGSPGEFTPSFTELQKHFVKRRPAKLKSLLRLVKHWYLKHLKAKYRKASLPAKYALEILTIYAWEMGTNESENFCMDEGLVAVMELLRDHGDICIYWTEYYDFQNEIVRNFIKEQLKESRPVILDPADPTNNLGRGKRWDLVAKEAVHCLRQVCCQIEDTSQGWHVQRARDVQVVVRQPRMKAWTLQVNPYSPIRRMKTEIKRTCNLIGQLRLSFQKPDGERQPLSNRESLADYGIFSKVSIQVLETFPPEIQVFVKDCNSQSKPYAIDPANSIRDLKKKIEEAGGPYVEDQKLIFQGRRLWDRRSLRDLQIKDGDTIELDRKVPASPQREAMARLPLLQPLTFLCSYPPPFYPKGGCVHQEPGSYVAISAQQWYSRAEMALAQELYSTPASRLDSFVARWLQPSREWKEEVLEAVGTVEQFLRNERIQGKHGIDQEVLVLKVVKVGSFGNGTVLRDTAEVELVVFLSCFHSFQEEAKYHQAILSLIRKRLWRCQDLLDLGLKDLWVVQGVPDALVFTIQTRQTVEPITVTIVPAYRALGPSVPNSQPPPEIYESLIEANGYPGNFSPSFSELQRTFVKHRPTKLKSFLRLIKHWYLQYVKAKSPKATLPPLYAIELLTIYAWEMGTQENENFSLDEGLATMMGLLQEYKFICIYWTKYYTFQNPIIGNFIRKQLKKERPIILDPVDPTHNVAEGYRWDIVAQRACQCLKQDCCYDNEDNPIPSWNVKRARDIQVTVEQWGYSDLILRTHPYESIRKIKEKIQRSRGYSGLQRLSFQEPGGERQLLSSHCSLAYYGVFSDIRICLLETFPPEIQVFVRDPHGGSHAYAIDPNSFILNLKQQIAIKQGLLSQQQQLKFQGQVLQDWLDLGSYGIQDSDTLILSKKKAERAPFPPR
ncbi:2'-5'-oligoadenylate synthase-like protein [Choloepus didactylus]|uniref:2'-5'-oligoadenylate synthase-like protein n=1 Tax=Choloepus didactylus TaxID=27675 RepID=UPI00189ECE78|nr:2'-5'-oligoadenylate synthase-like protein [Choloepus didactylus]